MVLMLILGLLMISRVPYPKIRNIKIIGMIAIVMVLLVIQFYLGMPTGVTVTAGLNLILIGLYILSPVFTIKKKNQGNH